MNGLVVSDKTERVYRYHKATLQHFQKLLSACGLSSPEQLGPASCIGALSPPRPGPAARSLPTWSPAS